MITLFVVVRFVSHFRLSTAFDLKSWIDKENNEDTSYEGCVKPDDFGANNSNF